MDEHICTPESCPEGANYFVTAVEGSRVVYWMAGPYSTHQRALEMVEVCRDIADVVESDPRGAFMSWGTTKSSRSKPGSLTRLGLL